jgi:hypothetical protein
MSEDHLLITKYPENLIPKGYLIGPIILYKG